MRTVAEHSSTPLQERTPLQELDRVRVQTYTNARAQVNANKASFVCPLSDFVCLPAGHNKADRHKLTQKDTERLGLGFEIAAQLVDKPFAVCKRCYNRSSVLRRGSKTIGDSNKENEDSTTLVEELKAKLACAEQKNQVILEEKNALKRQWTGSSRKGACSQRPASIVDCSLAFQVGMRILLIAAGPDTRTR